MGGFFQSHFALPKQPDWSTFLAHPKSGVSTQFQQAFGEASSSLLQHGRLSKHPLVSWPLSGGKRMRNGTQRVIGRTISDVPFNKTTPLKIICFHFGVLWLCLSYLEFTKSKGGSKSLFEAQIVFSSDLHQGTHPSLQGRPVLIGQKYVHWAPAKHHSRQYTRGVHEADCKSFRATLTR